MEIFRAHNIEKKYAHHLALDEVSVSIPQGSIYGLLGPNGAGKTTFIRIINQITAPDKGELFFKGRRFTSEDIYHIGYLPEERGLYKKMKVGEQALYLSRLKGMTKNDAMKSLKYWFEKFEIQAWWNKKIEELSKGMQQKIQFIITIIHKPELLIFDEPFSGFDPINTNLLKNEILELKKNGSTVIFSTHDMGSVEELCDHITLINKSKTLLDGPINDIRNTYKSNIFEIVLSCIHSEIKNLPEGRFEIVEQKNLADKTIIKVKMTGTSSGNDLLKHYLPYSKIESFREVIPGMNEIFIKVVQDAQKN